MSGGVGCRIEQAFCRSEPAGDNRGALRFIASKLAPTGGLSVAVGAVIDLEVEAGHAFHAGFELTIRQQP
ncbi:MAG: hypothetical protein JWP42_3429 [Pseudomonas sp.]|nr:hypothetical protein [Pseudomonas sp.]